MLIQTAMLYIIGKNYAASGKIFINFIAYIVNSVVDAILGALTLPDIGQLFPGAQNHNIIIFVLNIQYY